MLLPTLLRSYFQHSSLYRSMNEAIGAASLSLPQQSTCPLRRLSWRRHPESCIARAFKMDGCGGTWSSPPLRLSRASLLLIKRMDASLTRGRGQQGCSHSVVAVRDNKIEVFLWGIHSYAQFWSHFYLRLSTKGEMEASTQRSLVSCPAELKLRAAAIFPVVTLCLQYLQFGFMVLLNGNLPV